MSTPLPWPPKDTDLDLFVAVKKAGQWATWAIPDAFAIMVCHPETIGFGGRADEWGDWLPNPMMHRPATGPTCLDHGEHPEGLAPSVGGFGMVVMDYDDKRLWSVETQDWMQVLCFPLVDWALRTKQATAPARQLVRPLVNAGYLQQAVWDDGRITPLKLDVPNDVLWVPLWMEKEIRKSGGLAPANNDQVETIVKLPYSIPGWELKTFSCEEMLAGFEHLNEQYPLQKVDLQRWEAWAQFNEHRGLKAWFAQEKMKEKWEDQVSSRSRGPRL